MHEEMPRFLDIRGFSKINVGINRIELEEPHSDLAKFRDCIEVHLSPQLILGVKDTPKVELNRVTNSSIDGWRELRNN